MDSRAYSALPISSIELQSRKFPDGGFLSGDDDDDDPFDELPLIGVGDGSGSGSANAEGPSPDPAAAAGPPGSGVPGAVFNLATSIIGAGIMALPATMKVLGLVVGFVSIVAMGILSEISVELLVRSSARGKPAASYGAVVQSVFGRPVRLLAEVCVVVNNAGILVVYLIIIGDVMSGSAKHVGVLDQMLGHGGFWDLRRLVILIVLVLFLAPLCALERIDSLSVTSAASVALAVVFVFVSCAIALVKLAGGGIRPPRLGPSAGSKAAVLDLLVVIPIMSNAYICHFNVPPIYSELEGRTPKKMYRVGRISTVLCIAVYLATAVSGYLLFGDDTESDVLTNFDKDLGIRFSSILNYIVRIGYILHLILVFPVVHFSLRQTVVSLVFPGSAGSSPSRNRTLGLTALLLAVVYLGSTMVPNIWVAFKFTGATTGIALGFIFPCLIALRLDKQEKSLRLGERSMLWVMLIWAVVVSIVGVVGNIYSLKNQSE